MAEPFLELLKDNRTLAQLCEIYYQNTGMVISFHYPGPDGERVDFYPQEERSAYCKLVQSAPEGNTLCLACDREGLARARRKGGYHIYHCHAGLVDVAIPIDYRGEQVGSIYTGQVILEEPGEKKLRALHARLAIPRVGFERFAAAFATVKVVDQNRLLFCVRLLDLVANYIIKAENEIRLQTQIVLKDRELHRREMDQAHLEKTLKDLSISVLGGGRRSRPPAEAPGAGGPPGRQVVEKARAFIDAHYGQDITLDDVARAVFLSPNYFSSLFKKVTGASFKSSLVERRMLAAREMLAAGSLPIKEVVARAGFRDYNYFNRTFRATEGVPPAEYRSRRRGKGVT
jgi:AraC-like DNA-binding protein/ligand-binding sensor protein